MRYAVFCIIFVLFNVAHAGATSPMLEAYNAYIAALDRGDVAEAEKQCEKAWLAAEENNDENNAALLAYNLAEFRLHYLPKSDVVKPANRAFELVKATPNEGLPTESAYLLKTLADFTSAPNRENFASLGKARRAVRQSGLEISYPLFRANYETALAAMKTGSWRVVLRQSTQALKGFEDLELEDKSILAVINYLLGVGNLMNSKFEDLKTAYPYLQKAIDITGPQPYDKPNTIAVHAKAWALATGAVIKTNNANFQRGSGTRIKGKKINPDDYVLQIPAEIGRPETCPEVEWVKRDSPEYPDNLLRKGGVGAVIAHYSIDENGGIYDIGVWAEVPKAEFGPTLTKAMQKWQAKPNPEAPEACRKSVELDASFQLK